VGGDGRRDDGFRGLRRDDLAFDGQGWGLVTAFLGHDAGKCALACFALLSTYRGLGDPLSLAPALRLHEMLLSLLVAFRDREGRPKQRSKAKAAELYY